MFRNEDLDHQRCKPEFVRAVVEDLRWFGFEWDEGPDMGGPFGPYSQSERGCVYVRAFEQLQAGGFIYPCVCSRQDVLRALNAPHIGEEEPVYPGTCRSKGAVAPVARRHNWRFRVPEGEVVSFTDGHYGLQQFTAGRDFGDFIVWRHDDMPSYQLAVVVDDAGMRITEVVRGADLLLSTARQLLLYQALGLAAPGFFHCPLLTDVAGVRLAKRHDALSLRTLRAQSAEPEVLQREFAADPTLKQGADFSTRAGDG